MSFCRNSLETGGGVVNIVLKNESKEIQYSEARCAILDITKIKTGRQALVRIPDFVGSSRADLPFFSLPFPCRELFFASGGFHKMFGGDAVDPFEDAGEMVRVGIAGLFRDLFDK